MEKLLRLERLLAIVFMLLNREKIQAKELAQKFNVTIRTIYRDIKVINQAGIPIISINGIDGGFSIIDEYRIDKQVLTYKEMQSIVNALKGVNSSLSNHELDIIIDKICDLMPKSSNNPVPTESTEIAIDLVPWGMSKKYQTNIRKINKAIESKTLLKFLYSKIGAPTDSRSVEPLTIIFKGYTWYLFAYCKLRHDFRIFRISRMKNLQLTNQYFIPKKQSYRDYINWEDNAPAINLKFKFSKTVQSAVEDYFNVEDIIFDENGDLIISTKMPDTNWVYGFILSFGSYVEVIEPERIRLLILEEAKKISTLYKKTPN
jgi:predicted DNA-binding transcriptional regulator YafY